VSRADALGKAARGPIRQPGGVLALVATCISFTFINPFSHQSNLMVMDPGAYSTRTFAKFGIPLVIVSLATVSVVTWALLNSG
jgi:di/tricarboxylate transporter